MNRIEELDAIIEQFNLNKHPFYQDWRMGTLPISKLRDYANEYARFVDTIDEGWTTVGETFYANEEVEHERLWADFQNEIASGAATNRPETTTLVTAARNAFSQKETAYGGLYAFEAQQPETSRSKFDGLCEHYNVSDKGKEYFKVHADDLAERELLRAQIALLSDEEYARTKTACAVVCAAMWSALDGVYYAQA